MSQIRSRSRLSPGQRAGLGADGGQGAIELGYRSTLAAAGLLIIGRADLPANDSLDDLAVPPDSTLRAVSAARQEDET
jgi:hypothetical protein